MDAEAHIPFRFYSSLGWIVFTTLAMFGNLCQCAKI
jgi:hypothetical protein